MLLLLGSLTFILLAASCGGPQWIKGETGTITTFGLKYRVKTEDKGIWGGKAKGWLQAVRAFSILAVLATVAGLVASLLFAMGKNTGVIAGIVYVVAGVCALIGLAIFTDKLSGATFGWSFILGWIGVVFAVISGVFAFVKGRQSSSN